MYSTRTKQTVLWGYLITFVVAAILPLLRMWTGNPESVLWGMYLFIAITAIAGGLLWREHESFGVYLAASMAGAATAVGAVLGFLLLGILGKSSGFVRAFEWLWVALFLNFLLLWFRTPPDEFDLS